MKPNYRLHSEDEHQYHVHDGEHTFPVVKRGLSEKLHAQIQALPHYDEGTVDAQPVPMMPDMPGQEAGGGTAAPDYVDTHEFGAGGTAAQETMPTPVVNPDEGAQVYQATPNAPVVDQPSASPMDILNANEPKMPGGIGVSAVDEGAVKRQKDAMDAQAAAQKREADANAAAYQRYQEQLAARDAIFNKNIEENKRHQDDLVQQIQDFKIDPNHLWATSSPASKVAAIFGMLLAGGAGRGHVNVAMDNINKMIDRDIDAQKSELGKKNSLLSYYVGQGHDIRSAEQMARADLLTGVKMSVEMNHAANAGDIAKATSDQLAAALDQDIASKRFNAAAVKSGQELQRFQIQHAIWQQKKAEEQVKEQKLQLQQILDMGTRGELPASAMPVLDKDTRERAITLPNGKIALAQSPEAAKTANAALQESSEMTHQIKDLQKDIGDLGLLERGSPIYTERAARIKAKAESLRLMAVKGVEGLNRLNENELNILTDIVHNPAALFSGPGNNVARLNGLLDVIDGRVGSYIKQYSPGAKYVSPRSISAKGAKE